MAIPRNYAFNEGSIFVSYHQKFGTLLDIVNIVKRAQVGKSCIEPMAMYFTIELLRMVEALHTALSASFMRISKLTTSCSR